MAKKAEKRSGGESVVGVQKLVFMTAGELAKNPKNWRTHPPEQISALRKMIADPEVGFAVPVLFNSKLGRLVDGHGRLEAVTPDTVVPVLIGNWDVRGEAKLLASLDRLTGMAGSDHGQVSALLAEIGDELPEEIRALMEDEVSPVLEGEKDAVEVPEAWQVVVECDGEDEQAAVFERLKGEGMKVKLLTL